MGEVEGTEREGLVTIDTAEVAYYIWGIHLHIYIHPTHTQFIEQIDSIYPHTLYPFHFIHSHPRSTFPIYPLETQTVQQYPPIVVSRLHPMTSPLHLREPPELSSQSVSTQSHPIHSTCSNKNRPCQGHPPKRSTTKVPNGDHITSNFKDIIGRTPCLRSECMLHR